MRVVIWDGGGLGHTCVGVLSNCNGIVVNMLANRHKKVITYH